MRTTELVAELGARLGIELRLNDEGTCRVSFDNDDVDFELSGEALYIMADIAPATGREDAYGRLLKANWLGAESGGASIGLDAGRDVFALYAVERGDVAYEAFEARLVLFLKALRYWKEWLALQSSSPVLQAPEEDFPVGTAGMLRI